LSYNRVYICVAANRQKVFSYMISLGQALIFRFYLRFYIFTYFTFLRLYFETVTLSNISCLETLMLCDFYVWLHFVLLRQVTLTCMTCALCDSPISSSTEGTVQ